MADEIQAKRAELANIVSEIASDVERRILRDPGVTRQREQRRLSLERDIAEAEGVEYAVELSLNVRLGSEWHVVSNFGRATAVISGDVGAMTSSMVKFENTEEFHVSGLQEYFESTPIPGLGLYGLFVVKNSAWRAGVLASVQDEPDALGWLTTYQHFVLRGKGGELRCLARSSEARAVPRGIEEIRKLAEFWHDF